MSLQLTAENWSGNSNNGENISAAPGEERDFFHISCMF
jgi:hypothetical protein